MKYLFPDACIALFARAPEAGRVKTRLIPALGAEGACAVHRQLLHKSLALLAAQKLSASELWVDSQLEHADFASFSGPKRLQQGVDLGQRMLAALRQLLQHYRRVLLIGSDCPQLDERYLEQALLALENHDLVLGPALDGGYVLLGATVAEAALFRDMPWGTDTVLAQTLSRATAAKLRVHCLPVLADIDRPEDLPRLSGRH